MYVIPLKPPHECVRAWSRTKASEIGFIGPDPPRIEKVTVVGAIVIASHVAEMSLNVVQCS